MSKKGGTVESVQALRAIAAIVVAFFHCQLAYVRSGRADMHSLETYLFGFGAVGVHVFFVISGFIMVATNPDARRFTASVFYWRRLARIFPIYWICCALALPFHASAGTLSLSTWQIVAALALYPADAASIIGSGWTLPFELYFYLCFGVALAVFKRRAIPVLAVLFFFSTFIGVAHQWKSDWMHLLTNPLLIEFLMGAGIAQLVQKESVPLRLAAALGLIAVAMFFAGLLLGYRRLPTLIVWGVPSGLLVLALIWIEKARGVGIAAKALGRLGDSSYVLYLLHPVVILAAIKASIFTDVLWLGPVAGSVVIVGVSIGLAHIMHLTIEAPILKWLRAQWPRPRPITIINADPEPALI